VNAYAKARSFAASMLGTWILWHVIVRIALLLV
jgi:hypothetical protein